MTSRGLRAGGLAAILLLISTRSAQAHGGPIVFTGDAGPFRVEAYRTWDGSEGQVTFAYLLHVRDRMSGVAIDDARVVVSPRRDGQVLPAQTAVRLGEEYRVQFLVGDDQGWTVDVQIESTRGRAVMSHPIPPPTSPWEFATMFGVPTIALVTGWIVFRLRRGRGRRTPAVPIRLGLESLECRSGLPHRRGE